MELILAAACDDARVRPDGKLDLAGIFNELHAPGFPAAQERMTVVFVLEWERHEQGRYELRADLLDDDGRKVLSIEGHTDVDARGAERAPARTRLILPLEKVVFPHAGRYRFVLSAAGQRVPALTMFVARRAQD